MMEQLRFLFDYGVTPEQACIMCHFSSECGGCCVKCRAENPDSTCYGQNCSQPKRHHDGQRWEAWLQARGNRPNTTSYYVRAMRTVYNKAVEEGIAQKPDPVNEYYFPRRCALYQKTYKELTFIGGNRKYDWAQLHDFGTGDIPLHQRVSSMDSKATWWQRLLPRLYARKHNAANLQATQPGINLFDYI